MSDSFEEIALQQSIIRNQWLPLQMAVREVVSFEHLFGDGHFLLACHAALPSLLTPELLHLIRLNFLDQKQPYVPSIAEMDFLLSPLCRPVDDALFEVEPMIREALLFELQERYGWQRLQEIASFLLQYLHKRPEHRHSSGVAQLHEWIAQSYLQPDKVVEELQHLLIESVDTQRDSYQTLPQKIQIARTMELLAEPLESTVLQEEYQGLIHSARVLAYTLYGNKTMLRAPILSARTTDEQAVPLFPLAVQQWIRTIVPSQRTGKGEMFDEQAQKSINQDEINTILWKACDTLRGTVDASEYKNYILVMLFLKYVSDAWHDNYARYRKLFNNDTARIQRQMALERFVLPEGCDFNSLYDQRHADNIGELINVALDKIENANREKLEGVFRNIDFNFGKTKDRNACLQTLLEDFANPRLNLRPSRVGNLDVIGNSYEYLITRFASSTGKKAGEFYTPPEVSELLAKLLDPQPGESICDPVCGSGSLLIRCAHHVGSSNFALYGQERNGITWALAKMNMFFHGIDYARIEWGDTLLNPLLIENDRLMHFDVVVANPPFSLDKWGAESAPKDHFRRFHRGIPPQNRADYAFIQHVIETIKLHRGRAGVIMPHGVLFRGNSEGQVRQQLIEENLLDAVIGLPPNLFYGTGIPAAILLFRRNKFDDTVVFIDASHDFEVGTTQNKLRAAHIKRIVDAYQARTTIEQYCYIATREEIAANDFNLNITKYIQIREGETPEVEVEKRNIDRLLQQAGWVVQDYMHSDIRAQRGIALYNAPLQVGEDEQVRMRYLLYVDQQALGILYVMDDGQTVIGHEESYRLKMPRLLGERTRRNPLPFVYYIHRSGGGAHFICYLDPEPRSREVFTFHRPETLSIWFDQASPDMPIGMNDMLRSRLRRMPPLQQMDLRKHQLQAITNLESSLAENNPRTLVQMAIGSGKTHTAVSSIYRLLRYGGAHRILYLTDRSILATQTMSAFQQFVAPDNGMGFTELYNVQLLMNNELDHSANICIATIQRLYSMLVSQPYINDVVSEASITNQEDLTEVTPPKEVRYNPKIPIEFFDFIIVDECNRSIYQQWRPVLEYFDSFLVGFTAVPSSRALAFFNKDLVMRYSREQAIADGLVVDYEIYRIQTMITEQGSKIERGSTIKVRNRRTRLQRYEILHDDFIYSSDQIDRGVVATDQIRTILTAYRETLFKTLYPGRKEVPKTLIFAKNDNHADDIVQAVREVFNAKNTFVQKITERAKIRPAELIRQFSNSYLPRIIVAVDMLSTGIDIKPLEVLLFMRPVKSSELLEQMIGIASRTITAEDFQATTPDANSKTRFTVFDAAGVTEQLKEIHHWKSSVYTSSVATAPEMNVFKVAEQKISSFTTDESRNTLIDIIKHDEQIIDDINLDKLIGYEWVKRLGTSEKSPDY